MTCGIMIREAASTDMDDVLRVIRTAFDSDEEANLVQDLLLDETAEPIVSLLALQGDKALGHILFTKARMEPESSMSMSILAPLAVVPQSQHQGIGGRLVKRGCQTLSQSGTGLVFVLGHPAYYPRFGFKPAGELGFDAPYPVPAKDADAWMVKSLRSDASDTLRGKVIVADTLNKPEYWRE